jgi:hypothetical protein
MRFCSRLYALKKRASLFLVRAFDGRWVFDAPVRDDRLPRPQRASFSGRTITNSEDEVQRGRPGYGELIPRLAVQSFCREAVLLQQFDRKWVDAASRVRARGERLEARTAHRIHDRFGHDRPGRIAGADEQNVIGRVAHRTPSG